MSGPAGLIFRDDTIVRPVRAMAAELASTVSEALRWGSAEAAMTAVMAAGAWQAALEDAEHELATRVADLADALADGWLAGRTTVSPDQVAGWRGEGLVRLSRPEGFAYYALQPRALAEHAARVVPPGQAVSVVGVRTIGATLSAVLRAALAARGCVADRFTVRPHGHPYDRVTSLPPTARDRVAARANAGGWFLVVDEGPGLSGSSFLSVAEALVEAGAQPDRVILVGSHTPDPHRLVAPRAAERWARFRSLAPEPEPLEDGWEDLSGGGWRPLFWSDPGGWPAVWQARERLKRRSPDGKTLLKFEGLGPWGQGVHARANALGEASLGPAVQGRPDERGFVSYRWVDGRPLEPGGRPDVRLLARHATTRTRLFGATPSPEAHAALEAATHHNVLLATGRALPPDFHLPLERPAIVDGRLAPHEWIRDGAGRLWKTDGAAHGDDHLYPGPTDVAWDLAGAIVEWNAPPDEQDALLAAYHADSADDARGRLPPYILAYAAFRAATCALATHGADDAEAARLTRARAGYVRYLAW